MITRIITFVCGVLLVGSSHLCHAGIEPVSIAGSALAASVSGNEFSTSPDMSPDGRFVVFTSLANSLTTNDNNLSLDVFLRDRQSGTTTLISANTNGFSGNGYSCSPTLSANGAWAAFESNASDLTAGNTNRTTDIFVRSTLLGQTALVSVNTNGTSANRASTFPIITPDGRFVAFESAATDLVTNYANNNVINVYLRDLSSNTTVLVSTSTNPHTNSAGSSKLSGVSSDGRYVLFTSDTGYIAASRNTLSDVFLRDTQTQQTYWVSSSMSQTLAKLGFGGVCFNPVMSSDGQSIAYRASILFSSFVVHYDLSSDTSLVISSNSNAAYISKGAYSGPCISEDGSVVAYMDVTSATEPSYLMIKQFFVWEAVSNTNTLATVASDGSTPGNADSISPVLSADGRTLAFLSMATNLNANTLTGGPARLFIRNLTTGITKLVSSEINTEKAPGDAVEEPVLSADGSLVAFSSFSDGLVDNDNNGKEDVFVNNVQSGVTELISSKSSTMESLTASASSFMPANGMSSAGRLIVFSTAANDLVAGDTNLQRDVYERDLVTGKVELVSENADGTGAGNGCSMRPSVSADGSLVAFQSASTDLVTGDTNGTSDVFLRDMTTGQTRLISTAYGGVGSAWGVSDSPVITPDGHFVIFRSNARNLTAVLYNTIYYDLYAYDTQSGTNYQIFRADYPKVNPTILAIAPNSQYIAFSQKDDSGRASYYISDLSTHVNESITNNTQTGTLPAFSGDSRWMASLNAVTATSNQVILRDLVAKTNTSFAVRTNVWKISLNGDGSRVAYSVGITPVTYNKRQIFVYDRITGSNILVSANLAGTNGGNGDSRDPIISPDGRYVYFNSRSTDLVADSDVNGRTDVFVRDLTTGTTRMLSVNRFKTGSGNNLSVMKALSADGQVVAVESFASDLIPMDLNMTKDVFVLRVNATVEDSDNDGLPDSWEIRYFGNLDRDGTGDFDSDGMSDGAEFLAGTDPADKQSALMVTEIGKPDATGRIITWAAVPGNSYKIQYKTRLDDAAWEELLGTIKAESAVASKLDDTTNGSEQRFYRVMLVP